MGWLRQHSEGRQILVVTHVHAGESGYAITLAHGATGGSVEAIATLYPSRDAAFTAADGVVRSRYGGHACGASCSGWTRVPPPTT